MKGFSKEETELIVQEAIEATKNGNSLTSVFERVALKTKRAKGSIRNYYYNIIKDQDKKNELMKSFQDISSLKATKPEGFSKADEEQLLKSINDGKKQGKSVRRIIYELSGGNEKIALRYQNKYRNILKKQEQKQLASIEIRPEDFKYFTKLSKEIDCLVEKIKDKYAQECVKLKKENEELSRQIKLLKKEYASTNIASFFITDKKTN